MLPMSTYGENERVGQGKFWKIPGERITFKFMELPIPGEPGNRVIPLRESGIQFPGTPIITLRGSGI